MEDSKGHDVHTRAYACTECDKSFEWPDSLRKHRKREHPANGERATPYVCPECGRQYKWLESLRNHKKVKHPFTLGHDSSQHQAAGRSLGDVSELEALFDSKPGKDEFDLLDIAEEGPADPFGPPPARPRKRPRGDVDDLELTTAQQTQLQSRVLSDRLRYKAERDEARARNLELLEERDALKVRLKLEKGKSDGELEHLRRRCEALEQERDTYKAQLGSREDGAPSGAQDYRVTLAYGHLCEAAAQIESATEMVLNLGGGAQGSRGTSGQ